MKKLTLLSAVFAVCLLAGCENPIYQWLLPEKKDSPLGPLDINAGWNPADGQGAYVRNLLSWGDKNQVTLAWGSLNTSSPEFDHVEIYYSSSYSDIQSMQSRAAGSSGTARTTDKTEKTITIPDLENDKLYYFAVTPVKADGGPLGQALILAATPHEKDSERPDEVRNLIPSTGDGFISLSWDLPETHLNGGPAKKVVDVAVTVVPSDGPLHVDRATMKSASVTGLVNGKPYSLHIRTVNAADKKSYAVTIVVIPVYDGGVGIIPEDAFLWRGAHPSLTAAEGGQIPQEGWAYFNTTDSKAYVYADGVWKEMNAIPEAVRGMVWKGSLSEAPEPAEDGWAYFNTTDRKAYMYAGGEWKELSPSPGMIWKGSLAFAPPTPANLAEAEGWAYFNTTDSKAYVFSGGQWQEMSEVPEAVEGIVWKGSRVAAPAEPKEGWAYYNTSDNKAYVFHQGTWDIMSEEAPALGIVWQGSFPADPPGPQEGWAYFNTGDNKSYVFHNGRWEPMAGDPPALPEVLWVGAQPNHGAAQAANSGVLVQGLSYYNTGDNKAYVYSGNPGSWREMTEAPPAGIIWVGNKGNHAAAVAEHGSAEEGLSYYNTTDNTTYVYTGGGWTEMTPMTTYYRVLFDTRGGSFVSPQLVAGGLQALRPAPGPALPGFAFEGWYDDPAAGAVFDFSAGITSAVTVYARWTALPETLLDDFPYGTTIDRVWYISSASDWQNAVDAITAEGNGTSATRKNYILNITGSFEIEGSNTAVSNPPNIRTFAPEHITVAIRGRGTEIIKLKSNGNLASPNIGNLLNIGPNQKVLVRNLTLVGKEENKRRIVHVQGTAADKTAEFWLREGGKVTGNGYYADYYDISTLSNYSGSGVTLAQFCGGVYVKCGVFVMDGNASVFGNKTTRKRRISSNPSIGDSVTVEFGGGGVYVKEGSFTMRGSASVSENIMECDDGERLVKGTFTGGGVSVYSGVMVMEGNASVYGNKIIRRTVDDSSTQNATAHTEAWGGGVYVKESSFTMRGSASVYGNTIGDVAERFKSLEHENGSFGGGVAVKSDSTAVMEGSASVYGNTIQVKFSFQTIGGGVLVEGSSLTMRGSASVYGNTIQAGKTTQARRFTGGGGVGLTTGSSFNMDEGASVSGNKLETTDANSDLVFQGGGVLITSKSGDNTVAMGGNASVRNNTVKGVSGARGGGIAISFSLSSGNPTPNKLVMTGNASVSGNTVESSGADANADAIGGGIFFGGGTVNPSLVMTESAKVSGNTAKAAGAGKSALGGGIGVTGIRADSNPAAISLYGNSSIAGNSVHAASGDAQGGGVYLDGSAPPPPPAQPVPTAPGVNFNIYGGTVYGNGAGELTLITPQLKNQVTKPGSPSMGWDAATKAIPQPGINWKGSAISEADAEATWSPLMAYDAYFNSTDNKAYVYNGSSLKWRVMSKTFASPIIFDWKGPATSETNLESQWGSPQEGWAYFNTNTSKAYVYSKNEGAAIYTEANTTVRVWGRSGQAQILDIFNDEDRTILVTPTASYYGDGELIFGLR